MATTVARRQSGPMRATTDCPERKATWASGTCAGTFAAFDRYEPSPDESFLAGQALIEIDAAVCTLGGELSPAQQGRLAAVGALREAAFSAPVSKPGVRREGPKVGRNEPCPCGSGKKFKKCHGK